MPNDRSRPKAAPGSPAQTTKDIVSGIGARFAEVAACGGLRHTPNHEPTMWLRGRLHNLAARWSSGRFTTCGHLRLGEIGITALWREDTVTCGGRCSSRFLLTGAADRTCDRCGAVVPTIHPEIVQFGRAVVMFGLCALCDAREVGRG